MSEQLDLVTLQVTPEEFIKISQSLIIRKCEISSPSREYPVSPGAEKLAEEYLRLWQKVWRQRGMGGTMNTTTTREASE
jgi:hypothetical protein